MKQSPSEEGKDNLQEMKQQQIFAEEIERQMQIKIDQLMEHREELIAKLMNAEDRVKELEKQNQDQRDAWKKDHDKLQVERLIEERKVLELNEQVELALDAARIFKTKLEELEKGDQGAKFRDFIRTYHITSKWDKFPNEIEDDQEELWDENQVSEIATKFFFHWWNTLGNNTAEGFEVWWKENKSKFLIKRKTKESN